MAVANPVTAPASTPGPVVTTVTGSLTIDGHPTNGATSVGSAVQLSVGQPLHLLYTYTGHGGALGVPVVVTVTSATLALQFLGTSLSSWVVDESNPQPQVFGEVNQTVDLTQDRYLLAGVYAMVASLTAPNGTIWSETFYLRISAPYDLVAVTILAGVLALYEVVAVLRLLGRAQVERRVAALHKAATDATKIASAPGGALSGLLVGLMAVILAQQTGRASLSEFPLGVEYLVVGALAGAVLLGLLAREINRRNDRRARGMLGDAERAPATKEKPDEDTNTPKPDE